MWSYTLTFDLNAAYPPRECLLLMTSARTLSGRSAHTHITRSGLKGARNLPVILILSQRVVIGIVCSSLSDARVQSARAVLDVILWVLQRETRRTVNFRKHSTVENLRQPFNVLF